MEEVQKYFDAINIYKDIKSIDAKNIVICGMGGSAIAGDYVREIFDDRNIIVIRDYYLPKYINKDYLCICISYSGNTEETISCLKDAIDRGLNIISITSNGKLEEICKDKGIRIIKLPKGFQPRFAFPYIFVSLIYILDRNVINRLEKFLREIEIDEKFVEEVSKKLYEKPVTIICYNKYFPVALRFKTQLNENSKHIARIELIPEMNHNEIEAYYNNINQSFVIIKGGDEPERISIRLEYVKNLIEKNSVGDFVEIEGYGNYLKNVLYFTMLFDALSLKIAEMKNVNPYEIRNIESLKKYLSR